MCDGDVAEIPFYGAVVGVRCYGSDRRVRCVALVKCWRSLGRNEGRLAVLAWCCMNARGLYVSSEPSACTCSEAKNGLGVVNSDFGNIPSSSHWSGDAHGPWLCFTMEGVPRSVAERLCASCHEAAACGMHLSKRSRGVEHNKESRLDVGWVFVSVCVRDVVRASRAKEGLVVRTASVRR